MVKNPPAMQETWVPSLGWEDPLEKGKATHSLQCSGLENSMDCVAHGVAKSGKRLSDCHVFCEYMIFVVLIFSSALCILTASPSFHFWFILVSFLCK